MRQGLKHIYCVCSRWQTSSIERVTDNPRRMAVFTVQVHNHMQQCLWRDEEETPSDNKLSWNRL